MSLTILLVASLAMLVQAQPCCQPEKGTADNPYVIQVGHDWGAHEYLDVGGYLAGINIDMIAAVCEAAEVVCETVWDKYTNCWDSVAGQHSTGGEGVFNEFYDACSCWCPAINRVQIFKFSEPYLSNPAVYFIVRIEDKDTFNPLDITGKKIGFMDGWAQDEKCLALQDNVTGRVLDPSQIVHDADTQALVDRLIAGEVDAIYVLESFTDYVEQNPTLLYQVPDVFACTLGGPALMGRKDNPGLYEDWNRGFQIIRENGVYDQLCIDGAIKHAHIGEFLPCFDPLI